MYYCMLTNTGEIFRKHACSHALCADVILLSECTEQHMPLRGNVGGVVLQKQILQLTKSHLVSFAVRLSISFALREAEESRTQQKQHGHYPEDQRKKEKKAS